MTPEGQAGQRRDPQRVPVAIVGGGPVGMTAACLLGASGVHALVLERERNVHHLPRAAHLDDEVLRVFQSIGIAERVLEHTRPLTSMQLLDADRRLLLEFARPLQGPYGYPASNMFHQPAVERVLRAAAIRRHGVALRGGWEVERVDPADRHVRIHARERGTGTMLVVDTDYLLACDGARSPTRQSLGIGLRGRRFSQRWLVVDTVVDGGMDAVPHAQQVCDPRRPSTYVPMGGDRYRWEFQVLPGERVGDLTAPAVLARLLAPWIDLGRVRIDRIATYTFRARAAERWRDGRVFLLGDAAHQMPPFLGQGLCSGIRDAHNLAWKLALVFSGAADPALLDTYEPERAPHVAEITRFAVLFAGVMQGGGRGGEGLRRLASRVALGMPWFRHAIEHRQMPGLRAGRLVPPSARGRHQAGGSLLPQPVVALPDGTACPLDSALGSGFAVVGVATDPLRELTADAYALWERLGARFVVAVPPDGRRPSVDPRVTTVVDLTGTLTDWAERHDAQTVVVRPDRYIFGVAGTHRRAAPSLEELTAVLGAALLGGPQRQRPGGAAGLRPGW